MSLGNGDKRVLHWKNINKYSDIKYKQEKCNYECIDNYVITMHYHTQEQLSPYYDVLCIYAYP